MYKLTQEKNHLINVINQCDLLFSTLFLIQDHERTHTREKPLKSNGEIRHFLSYF